MVGKVRRRQGKLPGGTDKEPNLPRPLASGGAPSEDAGLGKTKVPPGWHAWGLRGWRCIQVEEGSTPLGAQGGGTREGESLGWRGSFGGLVENAIFSGIKV